MTVPGKPPHLTLVTNTEELRQRIADKIPKRRRGRPRKPTPASDPAKSGIIEQCVIYAQSSAAPLASKELLAKAIVLGIMGADSTNAQPAEMTCYLRFFAREVEQYLEAQGGEA